MPPKKCYVVWQGKTPGIYESWEECKRQTEGYEGALYKSFGSYREAEMAYASNPWKYVGKAPKNNPASHEIILDSLAVDAACSGNPGAMEYRGVYTATGEEIFHSSVFDQGTNNIGEFLAIVHGLALLKNQNSGIPIYTDSVNAMKWVKEKKCKTKLERTDQNVYLFELIERAENWLRNNTYTTLVLKWETKIWGEIPADFGRK
jgi:Predicted double-stranded RNA/RNA-DNA hybrid binding protein